MPNLQGCCGGVEGAFMSTSARRDVAKTYASRGQRPITFQMSVGEIDMGADVRYATVCRSLLPLIGRLCLFKVLLIIVFQVTRSSAP
jgi:hypothetical protein